MPYIRICISISMSPSIKNCPFFIEKRLVVAKGERVGGGTEWEFGVSRCKLLYIEWKSNRVLLYSTENYIQ